MRLLLALLQPVLNAAFRRCARRVLGRALPPHDARSVWARARELHRESKAGSDHSLGVNLLLRHLEWDRALYTALREAGHSSDDAGRLIEETNWTAIGPATSLIFSLSRLRSGRPRTRVRWTIDLMFATLFASPFRRVTLPSKDEVAFDVTACPLAEHFRAHGVPELTRYAACNLDHRMARAWRVELKRARTIAEGDRVCDFRFSSGREQ